VWDELGDAHADAEDAEEELEVLPRRERWDDAVSCGTYPTCWRESRRYVTPPSGSCRPQIISINVFLPAPF
jgi:hypothetical protein